MKIKRKSTKHMYTDNHAENPSKVPGHPPPPPYSCVGLKHFPSFTHWRRVWRVVNLLSLAHWKIHIRKGAQHDFGYPFAPTRNITYRKFSLTSFNVRENQVHLCNKERKWLFHRRGACGESLVVVVVESCKALRNNKAERELFR